VDATEPQEPSYYEVALTNRQVLIAFVALLICLLVAFLSGVWIGRGGAEEAAVKTPPAAPAGAADAPIEQLSFFNGTETAGGAKSAVPAPSAAPVKPEPAAAAKPEAAPPVATGTPAPPAGDASDAMRQNLEATMAANRETPAMKMAVGERTGQAPATAGSPPASATPPAAATPQAAAKPAPAATAAAKPPVAGKLFVQVYSSGNGQRAREIVANLRKAGFPVVISETPKANGKNFRVRVGPFADRAAADAAAIKLRRDHRLDTWVTDSP